MDLARIEIITGMSKFNGLKATLSKAGVRGMTVTQVLGCGIEKGTKEYEVDENYEMELLPKQQIALVVEKSKVDEIVELIKQELYTGHIGDGKIFVYNVEMQSESAPVQKVMMRFRIKITVGWLIDKRK